MINIYTCSLMAWLIFTLPIQYVKQLKSETKKS